ncbi:ThiF family adenylyltransferase [Bacillus thuringiensis]|uniref:ThiF family adenylyltransferase n=1 Tax=Bacillus thuringiensis TaxID=1428 RepID=UPI0035DFF194
MFYKIKDIHPVTYISDTEIIIGKDRNFMSVLKDSDGFLKELLNLLDGNKSVTEIFKILHSKFPSLTKQDVWDTIKELNNYGHIEQCLPNPIIDNNRHLTNLHFFSNFSSMDNSAGNILKELQELKIGIIGLGGLGSNLLLQLAGLGVNTIYVVDPDKIEYKNLNRQFLYKLSDIGEYKVKSAINNIKDFNDEISITGFTKRINSVEDLLEIFPEDIDILVCAADSPPIYIQLWSNLFSQIRNIPLITGGLGCATGQILTSIPNQTPCLECFYHDLLGNNSLKKEKLLELESKTITTAIGPYISLIANLICTEIINYSLKHPLASSGKKLSINYLTLEITHEKEWLPNINCICKTKKFDSNKILLERF